MASSSTDIYGALVNKLDALVPIETAVPASNVPTLVNPFGLTGKNSAMLRQIEAGDVAVDAIPTLPASTINLLQRRRLLRKDATTLVDFVQERGDMTPARLAVALGFPSWAQMLFWARRNDKALGTRIEEACHEAAAVMADYFEAKAVEIVEGIGSLVYAGKEISLAALAHDHAAALEEQDDATAFRIAQQLPLVAKAVEIDAKRRLAVAEQLQRRAATLAPSVYGSRGSSAPTGPAQQVTIVMDMGAKEGMTKVVNPTNAPQSSATGIVLDMT